MARTPSDYDDVVEQGRGRGARPVLRIRVRPRSHRKGVLGVAAGSLTVAVSAAPEGGKATAEALAAVARWLGLAPSRLELIAGAASRAKRVAVTGLTADELRRRVAAGGIDRAGKHGERRPDNGP